MSYWTWTGETMYSAYVGYLHDRDEAPDWKDLTEDQQRAWSLMEENYDLRDIE